MSSRSAGPPNPAASSYGVIRYHERQICPSDIRLKFHLRFGYIIGWAEDWSRLFVYEFDPLQPDALGSAKDLLVNGESAPRSSLEELLDTRFIGEKGRVFLFTKNWEETKDTCDIFEKAMKARAPRIVFDNAFLEMCYSEEEGADMFLRPNDQNPLKIGKIEVNPTPLSEIFTPPPESKPDPGATHTKAT